MSDEEKQKRKAPRVVQAINLENPFNFKTKEEQFFSPLPLLADVRMQARYLGTRMLTEGEVFEAAEYYAVYELLNVAHKKLQELRNKVAEREGWDNEPTE